MSFATTSVSFTWVFVKSSWGQKKKSRDFYKRILFGWALDALKFFSNPTNGFERELQENVPFFDKVCPVFLSFVRRPSKSIYQGGRYMSHRFNSMNVN